MMLGAGNETDDHEEEEEEDGDDKVGTFSLLFNHKVGILFLALRN